MKSVLISNTGPIIDLSGVNHLPLLPRLYARILVPDEVDREIQLIFTSHTTNNSSRPYIMQLDANNIEVIHNQKEPVIILGHARSGTSILGDLLRKYLRISFGPESQFLIRVYQHLPRYGDLTQEKNLSRLLHDILQERCFQRWQKKFGYSLDQKEIFNRIQEPSYKGALYAVFDYLARCGGMHRWGDKTPMCNLHLDVIQELFPNSRYIHVVRDGRDVALSSFNIHFGSKNVYKVKIEVRLTVPNPHAREISVDLLKRLLSQADISREEWIEED